MSLLANSNAIESGGYNIQRSLRLRSSASAYLNRTYATPTSNKIWTWSGWVKLGALGVPRQLLSAGSGAPVSDQIFIGDTNIIRIYLNGGYVFESTQVLRDPSAFYHLIVATDTTQATAANRTKVYLNGQQITAYTGTAITQNADTKINSAVAHYISRYAASAAEYFDGYLAEVNFIDGQALTPSSFGQTDAVTGVWTPKKYTGTYGTNGFYLPFSDNTSATTLAYDKSGNGNNWTPNNISTTAGVTYDSMTDVPTLTSATAANYCVMNPLDYYGSVANASGNLQTTLSAVDSFVKGTMAIPTSGKYYWEVTCASLSGSGLYEIGVIQTQYSTGNSGYLYSYTYVGNGNKRILNSYTAYGSSYTTNDVIGVAFDADAGSITFYKNNVSQGAATTGITAQCSPMIYLPSSATATSYYANFGQRPFSYTPPTGFKALNTFNLPDPTIKKPNQYMDATTYTGNGGTLAVTNSGSFQPDFVWIKERPVASAHAIYDSSRGNSEVLSSNSTAAGYTQSPTAGLTSFNSNGFSATYPNTGDYYVNRNGQTYVGWQWKKGATPGFDIVTFTGNGSARTVSHSLGVAPKMILLKSRSATGDWWVYHESIGATKTLFMSLTDAALTFPAWNNTAPTSSVFSVGSASGLNANGVTQVAYCFAEIPGFSKFGSYTGNGNADGPFVYCGFRPKYVMVKRTDSTSDWGVYDSARDTYNQMTDFLFPNASYAETAGYPVDFLSNGFKMRNSAGFPNNSGGTFIFAAFAENPMKYSLAK